MSNVTLTLYSLLLQIDYIINFAKVIIRLILYISL